MKRYKDLQGRNKMPLMEESISQHPEGNQIR
jgi:hypothetical protein